jgi:ligand-binding SRPBCC domain-containing protein
MRHHFTAEQWLPYSVELVFSFFANPENLPRLMPAWQKARIEEASFAPPPPRPPMHGMRLKGIAAGAGTRMTISFRPFPYSPFRVPWDATIDEFTWNDHFCDSQGRGPFAFWHHCHYIVAETRNGIAGSLVRDQLEYEMPLGPLGELGHTLFVQRQLQSTFAYRQRRTEEWLGKIVR